MKRNNRLAIYAWIVVVYNILVIVYGAFVRATGSGAGCGSHWPLCNGVVVPIAPSLATMIEFAHRVTSGITLILIAILVIWVWRTYPKRSWLRVSSTWVAVFVITESLIGAGLVLFQLVAYEASLARAISMALHLVNTFLLMAALVVTAWWLTKGVPAYVHRVLVYRFLAAAGAVGLLIVGASGALTALGDTVFPVGSLAEGLQQDIDPTAHFLVRLRVFHPVFAVLAGVFVGWFSLWLRDKIKAPTLKWLAPALCVSIGAQIFLGGLNVVLLAPVWLQLVHLAVTNLIWLLFVLVFVFAWIAPDLAFGIPEDEVHESMDEASAGQVVKQRAG